MDGGMQAAQGDNNQQTMETNVAAPTEKQLDKAEVVVLLEQLKADSGCRTASTDKEEATSP